MLSELSPDKHCVDVLAVIDKIGEASNMLVKSKSEEVLKREMHLVDESNTSVALLVSFKLPWKTTECNLFKDTMG